jgi:Icc-related predicted phosphoesterase
MSAISINNTDWKRVKIKLQRKYNHLTDEQLQYNAGEEDQLIDRLANLVNRDREYVIFTLKKALVNIDNNRL